MLEVVAPGTAATVGAVGEAAGAVVGVKASAACFRNDEIPNISCTGFSTGEARDMVEIW